MLFLLLSQLPSAQAAVSPAPRWGHQAVYVEAEQAMYVVGGEVSGSGTQVTNEVLVYTLNSTSPAWNLGPNTGLSPHAFASMALTHDASALVVAGGMTSSCTDDATTHTFTLGGQTWTSASPVKVIRRHGAGLAAISDKQMMLVGGLSDTTVCSGRSGAYTATDMLSLPLGASSIVTSQNIPTTLTGTDRAVSDFAMTNANGTIYLMGGQAYDGTLVPHSTIGVWTQEDGWVPQKTTGQLPEGRLGASLVAHPFLDMLVLHGGSVKNGTSYASSTLLATLNTTTWEWSQPSNLQPPSFAAVAYHSAVMTPSGVMITAFGRGPKGSPMANEFFLDMRDPTTSGWGWKSQWSQGMLDTYTGGIPAADHGEKKGISKSGKIAAAVVPTLIVLLVLLPLGLWFWRRHQRNARKRRLASHFSFSTQEDNGEFNRPYVFGNVGRGDHNEKSTSNKSSLSNLSNTLFGVFRRHSAPHGVGDDGTIHEREMAQVHPSELNEKGMNWEEIDFGLGRVDEARREGTYTDLPARRPRRSSFTSPGSPAPEGSDLVPIPMPIASTYQYQPETVAAHQGPALGNLVDVNTSPRIANGELVHPDPTSSLAAAAADAASADAADWEQLQSSLTSRPAFRAISPTAQLRSHQHSSPLPQEAPVPPSPTQSHHSASSSAPSIPPLDFHTSPIMSKRASMGNNVGHGRTISNASFRQLTNNKRNASAGSAQSNRRSSANALGMARLHIANPDGESR